MRRLSARGAPSAPFSTFGGGLNSCQAPGGSDMDLIGFLDDGTLLLKGNASPCQSNPYLRTTYYPLVSGVLVLVGTRQTSQFPVVGFD